MCKKVTDDGKTRLTCNLFRRGASNGITMQTEEQELIRRIAGGETRLCARLVDRYGRAVYTLAARIAGYTEDAEELTQDIFLKAFSSLDRFGGRSSFSTWLYRIAYRTSLVMLRATKRAAAYPTPEPLEQDPGISEELRAALDEMFRHSSVLLAQEFIPTEFDWRIGLLDGEPLFACKYYMAKGHWQIYNHAHDDTGRNLCGAWETVPIYKAPQKVLDTAVKAAALIGKGLYGVDLKLINGRAVVIEINDNPSIDHEVEDAVLGDELYYRILNHFVHCLNRLHAQ